MAEIDPSEHTVGELEERVGDIDDVDALREILDEEEAGKDRVTAKRAVQGRIEDLSPDDEDTDAENGEEGDRLEAVEGNVEDALETVDSRLDSLLYEILETESRVAVYVGLRKQGSAEVDEVVEETGLSPDKVETVLDDLEGEDVVDSAEGEYFAVSPTSLVRRVPNRVGNWMEDIISQGGPGSGEDGAQE